MGGGCSVAYRLHVRLAALALITLAASCATTPPPVLGQSQQYPSHARPPAPQAAPAERPHIVAAAKPLQCVPYARQQSGIEIYGNANEWWKKAAGKYRRDRTPAPGTVMVFKGFADDPRGHVAIVRSIKNSRTLIVDHANWLGRGEITVAVPVMDVSPKNDWSEVRVWYIPGDQWGQRVFAIAGFIYPDREFASAGVTGASRK